MADVLGSGGDGNGNGNVNGGAGSKPRFYINEDEQLGRIWMAGVNMQMIECINLSILC